MGWRRSGDRQRGTAQGGATGARRAPTDELSPPEALRYLHPELRTTWADLDGAPPAIAEATAQLLPFGSRAALEALGLVVPGTPVDDHGHHKLHVTRLGYAVMAEAAAADDTDAPSSTEDWGRRASAALAHLEEASQRKP